MTMRRRDRLSFNLEPRSNNLYEHDTYEDFADEIKKARKFVNDSTKNSTPITTDTSNITSTHRTPHRTSSSSIPVRYNQKTVDLMNHNKSIMRGSPSSPQKRISINQFHNTLRRMDDFHRRYEVRKQHRLLEDSKLFEESYSFHPLTNEYMSHPHKGDIYQQLYNRGSKIEQKKNKMRDEFKKTQYPFKPVIFSRNQADFPPFFERLKRYNTKSSPPPLKTPKDIELEKECTHQPKLYENKKLNSSINKIRHIKEGESVYEYLSKSRSLHRSDRPKTSNQGYLTTSKRKKFRQKNFDEFLQRNKEFETLRDKKIQKAIEEKRPVRQIKKSYSEQRLGLLSSPKKHYDPIDPSTLPLPDEYTFKPNLDKSYKVKKLPFLQQYLASQAKVGTSKDN